MHSSVLCATRVSVLRSGGTHTHGGEVSAARGVFSGCAGICIVVHGGHAWQFIRLRACTVVLAACARMLGIRTYYRSPCIRNSRRRVRGVCARCVRVTRARVGKGMRARMRSNGGAMTR